MEKIMYIKKIIYSILLFLFSIGMLHADTLRISQIDSSGLLIDQNINLYISTTGNNGEPIKGLNQKMFSIFESADNKNFRKVHDVVDFKAMANYEKGINILLLVDNSGSMYMNMEGRKAESDKSTRIYLAKKAVRHFLASISNPKDRIGLVTYNTYYNSHSGLTDDINSIENHLDNIEKPDGDQGFSEIYASLHLAVDEFRSVRGRKVIIILSDGENWPYSRYTGESHKNFGMKTFKYTEPLQNCQEEGISVFSIYFGRKGGRKDRRLNTIALESGGTVFDAHSEHQLNSVYDRIANLVLNEYMTTYRASMEPTDKKYVRVEYSSSPFRKSATRFYFSSTVFGVPLKEVSPFFLILFIIPIFLLWILSLFKFENKSTSPSLEILNPGTAGASTKFLELNKGKTVIGGDLSADLTIAGGLDQVSTRHATIVYNNRKRAFTLEGEGRLKVNNRAVTTKVLEPGDVINVGGATMVFDDGLTE